MITNFGEMDVSFWIGMATAILGAAGLGASAALWIAESLAKRERERHAEESDCLRREIDMLRRQIEGCGGDASPARTPDVVPPHVADAEAGRPQIQEPGDKAPQPYPEPEIASPPSAEALKALPVFAGLPPVSGEPPRMAWAEPEFRRGRAVVVPSADFGPDAPPTFIMGDLHGDVASLRRILAYVHSVSRNARIVFLGDISDRAPGRETVECVRLMLWVATSRPGSFLWIRGNHDALAWNAEAGKFVSGVVPHDFTDFLNGHSEYREEGKALAALMGSLPVAAALGGVFLSHGGVLQDDEAGLRSFSGLAALSDDQCSDLVWSRMRDVRSKLASRHSRGAEVGFRQAKGFAAKLAETDGLEIRHFVCGHQHEARDGFGYLPFDSCFVEEITCQCVTSFLNRDALGMPARPVILRVDGNRTPVPVFFPIPDEFRS